MGVRVFSTFVLTEIDVNNVLMCESWLGGVTTEVPSVMNDWLSACELRK